MASDNESACRINTVQCAVYWWRAYIMKNNRTRDGLVCGVWGCADTAGPASMLSAPAFIYHFGWEVSFALVSQPFNRTFITTDCSRSVARITNSTSPNNLQMESWWESLEFGSVFTSTPPFLKLQPGKILQGNINAWGKQQAHLDILMSARCSRLEEESSYLYLYLLNLSVHSRSHGRHMEQVFSLSTLMTSYRQKELFPDVSYPFPMQN